MTFTTSSQKYYLPPNNTMVRQYVQVTDTQRLELVHMIHTQGHSIAKASKMAGIPYDNAKAINRTYLREKRVNKINYRLRY